MRALFSLFSLRHLLAHKLRAFLGLSAVALGIALYTSTAISISSARDSMRQSARALAGRAEWQVSRGPSLGVEEDLARRLSATPGAIAAPVIQSSVVLE